MLGRAGVLEGLESELQKSILFSLYHNMMARSFEWSDPLVVVSFINGESGTEEMKWEIWNFTDLEGI